MKPVEWAVRDEAAGTETGFGTAELVATQLFDALVKKARDSGVGGEYSLKRNGQVIANIKVPRRGGD